MYLLVQNSFYRTISSKCKINNVKQMVKGGLISTKGLESFRPLLSDSSR